MAKPIVQEGTNYRLWSQLYSSEAAAKKAQIRQSNMAFKSGKTKIPTASEIVSKALKAGKTPQEISAAAAKTVQKTENLAQNQTEAKKKDIATLKGMADIWKTQTTDTPPANTDWSTEWTEATTTPEPLKEQTPPVEIDPESGAPIQVADAWAAVWSSVDSSNAAGNWGWSAGWSNWGSNGGWSSSWGGYIAWGWNNAWVSQGQWVIMQETGTEVGSTVPWADAPLSNQSNANKVDDIVDTGKINEIKPDTNLWLNNSPDSPYWNKFGNAAIEQETGLPGYMNERNKVIAQGLMLKNPNMKSMSDADRKQAIIEDIVARQWENLNPDILDWYQRTADNINNLITAKIPPYTSNDFFGMLLNWKNISEDISANQQNPSYINAKRRYDSVQTYSTMNTAQLTEAIKSWSLVKGTVLWNDLMNKWLGQVLNDAYSGYTMNWSNAIYNKVMSDVSKFDPDIALAMQSSIGSDFDLWTGLDSIISMKILQTMTEDKLPTLATFLAGDKEVQKAKTESKASEKQLNDLKRDIESFSDDIKETVVENWGEATGDPFLESYIQEKTKPFIKKWETINDTYRNQIAKLDNATENAKLAFDIKEYNKNLQVKWYEFILNSLEKKAEAKAAADKLKYERDKDERDFTYKVLNDQRDYDLAVAKANKSGGGGSWWKNANDILQGIYNGTITAKGIFTPKVLESLGLSWVSRWEAVNLLTEYTFKNNLTQDSSFGEVKQAVDSVKNAFPDDYKSGLTYLPTLKNVIGTDKTLKYVVENITDLVGDKDGAVADQDVADALKMVIPKNFTLANNSFRESLVTKLGKESANYVADAIGLSDKKSSSKKRYNPFD